MLDRTKYSAPISCTINVTQKCNLRCLHCSASAGEVAQGEMSTEQLMNLAKTLVEDVGVFSVPISGGEPLLREDTFLVLNYLSQKKVHSTLFTNATLVTDDIAKKLSDETCLGGKINTSIDGATDISHDMLRGNNAFNHAIRGIKKLIKNNLSVGAHCIIHKKNMKTLPDIVKLAEEIGLSGITFGIAEPVGYATKHADMFGLTKSELDYAFDMVSSLNSAHDIVNGGTILGWSRKHNVQEMLEESGGRKESNINGLTLCHCDICKESVAITPDGWMVPCNKFWEYRIGNVFQENFLDLYRNSKKANKIRDLMSIESDQLEGCGDCNLTSICNGGCRALAFALSGSLLGIDQYSCLKHYIECDEDDQWFD